MRKYRQYVLPAALVVGLLLHSVCGKLAFLVPYLIFTILVLTFSAFDLRRLRITALDIWLMSYQIVVAAGLYIGISLCGGNKILAEATMMGVLCPVAASSTVISCMLGAKRETVTGYSIIGNLMVAVVAPVFFTLIGDHPEQSLGHAYLLMLGKIGSTLAVPFFLVLLFQVALPKVNGFVARYTGWSYYVWACALLLTIGQTIDYIFIHGKGNWHYIAWMGVLAAIICAMQFWLGRKLGSKYGDKVSGAQLMAQKNSSMGIWMANTFLTPLSSVFLGFYSIYQNIYNAYQIAKAKKQ